MKSDVSNSKYPGVDGVPQKIISRSLDPERNESIGFGFMKKSGTTIDEKDFCFSRYALVYVIRGDGEYVDPDGTRHPLSPGSVFQRHPGVRHSTYLDPDSDWRECFLDFGRTLYESLVAYKIINPRQYVLSMAPDKTIESDFFSLMSSLELAGESDIPYLVSKSITLLTRILKRAEIAGSSEMDEFIDRTCAFFARHPERRIDVEKYCLENGVGYENFRKHFKDKTGTSPGKYIINRRMDAACEMLRISKRPINQIAADLGYSSPYEFSAQFKKNIGVSPKLYRR